MHLPSLADIAAGIMDELLTSMAVVVLFTFQRSVLRGLSRLVTAVQAVVTGKRFVLVWNDVDRALSRRLATLLENGSLPGLVFRDLATPEDILNYALIPRVVGCVVLLITDVTKLSEDAGTRDKIQEALAQYVARGGGLIGSHDIVYRRVRNKALQRVFGGMTAHFRRTDQPVVYVKDPETLHPVAQGLPDSFSLNDGEVVWGTWDNSVVPVFRSPEGVPLVTVKKHGLGRVVWLNSGDNGEHLARSVAVPEPEFLTLLENSVRWTGLKDRPSPCERTGRESVA